MTIWLLLPINLQTLLHRFNASHHRAYRLRVQKYGNDLSQHQNNMVTNNLAFLVIFDEIMVQTFFTSHIDGCSEGEIV